MPWCPNCKTEYREGIGTCADCGEALTEALPVEGNAAGDKSPEAQELLVTARDEFEAGMLSAMLESHGIPSNRLYQGAGSFLKAYAGNTVFGVDIYVLRSCLEEARALLETDAPEDEERELWESAGGYEAARKQDENVRASHRRTGAWLLLVLFISGVILFAVGLLIGLLALLFR